MADEQDVRILFGADTSQAQSGIDQITSGLQDMQDPAEELNSSFNELKDTLIAAFSVEAIKGFVEQMAALGTEIEAMEIKFNMSGQQVQEWRGAMQSAGGSVETMSRSMTLLSKNIDAAIEGPGRQRDAFQALGITTEQLKANYGDLNSTALLVANGFQTLHAQGGGISELLDVMGRGAANLAPLFAGGATAVQGLLDKFQQFTISDQVVSELHDIHEESTLMGAALQQAGANIISVFKPAIDAVIGSITDLAQEVTQLTGDNDLLGTAVALITTTFDGFRVGILSVVTALRELGLAALAAYQVLIGNFSGADATWKQLGVVADEYKTKMDGITKSVEDLWTAQQKLNGGGGAGGGTTAKPPGQKGGDEDDLAFDKQDIADELALQNAYFDQKKALAENDLAAGRITKQQEFAAEQEYLTDKYQAEESALTQELGIYQKDSQEYQKTLDEKELLTVKYQTSVAQLNAKSQQEQNAQYKQFFNSINQGFGQMVQGVLQGTQTWQQALARMFDDLLAKFIDDFVIKKVTAWVESELTMTTATATGNATRLASTQAAATAGGAASAASSKGQVSNDAATAAANVYSSVSAIPLVGWILAPAAAAVAFGAVEAFGSGIASFDVGSYNVPSDQIAQIHQGEMIIPKTFADSLRQGGGIGGAGQSYNVTINAVDANSVANLLNQNSGVIAQIMTKNVRNFNTNTQQIMRK